MINLIPPDAEKEVRKEYWVRVVSVWLFLLGSAFCIIALLYMPAYLLISAQLEAGESEYVQASDQSATFKTAQEAIAHTNDVATLLTKKNEEVAFSLVLKAIETLVPSGVTIESYTFGRKGVELGNITVSGVAGTRASLSSFRTALEGHSLFMTASLPLSDLAKDKDISFSVTITPRSTKETP